MIKKLLLTLGILSLVTHLIAWTGSDPTIQIIYPDGVLDNTTAKVPVNVKIKQKNTSQGVDFGRYWLVEETGSDTYISTAEWAARVQIPDNDVEDINRTNSIITFELGTDKLTQNTYYYIVGVQKDMIGDTSCDTTLIPDDSMNGDGDSTISDTAIARFYVEGFR